MRNRVALGLGLALLVMVSPVLTGPTRITRVRTALAGAGPQVMFGMGPEVDGALSSQLVQNTPVKLLTSWYNGPQDLQWMANWRDSLIPQAYARGYALQLVTWTDVPNASLETKYGPACGRPYPLSSGFLGDMKQLAQIWAGSGPLYVSLFAEFQTYPCTEDQWVGAENYYRALKDQYLAAKAIFHQYAPNARVALSWGGWQARWDDPAHGGGLSLVPYFSDVMAASDFQSFQEMNDDSNVADVQNMTKILGAYGPVMLAYYKPENNSQTTFDADTRAMLTDSFLAQQAANGLFAFAFMDNYNLGASASSYQFVASAVDRYAAPWIVPPSPTAASSASSTPKPAATSTVTPQSGNSIEDTFSRSDQTGWGASTNDDGVPAVVWGMAGNGDQPFVTISNNSGVYGYPGVTNVVGIASAGSALHNGGDVLAEFTVSAVGHVTPYVVENACSDTSCYYGARLHTSQGALEVAKRSGYVTTTLAAVPFTLQPNVAYWVRLHVTPGPGSTTLQARVWSASTAEPTSWMVSATDSSPLAANVVGAGGTWDQTGTGESIRYSCYGYAASGLATACTSTTSSGAGIRRSR